MGLFSCTKEFLIFLYSSSCVSFLCLLFTFCFGKNISREEFKLDIHFDIGCKFSNNSNFLIPGEIQMKQNKKKRTMKYLRTIEYLFIYALYFQLQNKQVFWYFCRDEHLSIFLFKIVLSTILILLSAFMYRNINVIFNRQNYRNTL